MAKFRCPYGHVEAKDGLLAPMNHESRARCSIYVKLRSEHKVDIFGRPVAGTDISSYMIGRTTPPAPGPAAAPPPAEPEAGSGAAAPSTSPVPPAAEKESLGKRLATGLGIRYRQVGTTPPGTAGAPAGESDWIASEETTLQFWSTIFGFLETAINLITQFFEIPPVPKEVFELDPGQQFVFRTALRGATTNILKKVFGAKSPEEADRVVAGLSGLLGFGMVAIKIVLHFMLNLPKSPKLARWKANREKALEERKLKLEHELALRRGGAPGPAGATAGAAG